MCIRDRMEKDWEPLPDWVVPTIEEVQEELVDRRRRRLLDKLGVM